MRARGGPPGSDPGKKSGSARNKNKRKRTVCRRQGRRRSDARMIACFVGASSCGVGGDERLSCNCENCASSIATPAASRPRGCHARERPYQPVGICVRCDTGAPTQRRRTPSPSYFPAFSRCCRAHSMSPHREDARRRSAGEAGRWCWSLSRCGSINLCCFQLLI